MTENREPEALVWHAVEPSEVAQHLDVDPERGLSSEEAAKRLEEYGQNTVTRRKGKSALQMLLSQFTDPLVFILVIAAIITFLLGEYIDTAVISAVVIINALIGFIQEGRAKSAIESLSKLMTIEAAIIRDGETIRESSLNIVPGDVIILQAGDKVPADIRIASENDLQNDESILTGESAPVSKSPHKVQEDDPVSDRVCMAYSGTLVTKGSGKGIVTATGDVTELGKISELIAETPEISTPLTRKLAFFGKWLSFAILGVSILTFAIGVALGREAVEMFFAAVAIAIAMIPEGLPAIVTIVLAVGVRRMADRKAIIRNLPSVETLGSVTVICSDKTGTLTANQMTVSRVFAGMHDYEFSGIGYDPTDTKTEELESEAFIECMRCGLLCNDSDLLHDDDTWKPGGDPTEVALITSAMKVSFDPKEQEKTYKRIDTIPFESATMYMATLHDMPNGERVIYVKGSAERILEMCKDRMMDDGETDELNPEYTTCRAEDLAEQGFRLLAFARKTVPAELYDITNEHMTDLTFLGLQAMSDPPRPEAIEAIQECRNAGITVKMITGDHITTAVAIGKEMGIGGKEGKAVRGSELRELDDEEFVQVANETCIFARVAPEQKYRLVEALQSRGNIAAMTGDGVNDAPALKKADIGVAMGKAGSEVAKDASDMVLTDDNFASIVAAVEEGRAVFRNLVKTLAYILPTNGGEGLVILVALIGGFVLPVTPVQVLWINTVTAVTLALPLAFEPKEPDLMLNPPRKPDAPMLTNYLIFRIIMVAVFMVVASFGIFWFERAAGVPIDQARTAAVGTIVAFEIFYLFTARSLYQPIWKIPLWRNPYLWIGVFLVVIFQLAFTYLPIMNTLFGSAPISLEIWVAIILVSFPIIIIVDIEKTIRNKIINSRS